jgi:hypothetical protein
MVRYQFDWENAIPERIGAREEADTGRAGKEKRHVGDSRLRDIKNNRYELRAKTRRAYATQCASLPVNSHSRTEIAFNIK